MTESTTPDIPTAADTDVFITRAFDAPRDVVWRFFTEPALLATWFGPVGVHVDPTSVEVDLRVGGVWNLDMVSDESGERYPLRARLTDVVPPEYLAGELEADAADAPVRGVTLRIWLHDHGDKTRLTLHQGPFEPQFRDVTRDGWLESFGKIDAALAGGVA